MEVISKRLCLREMTQADFLDIAQMLRDKRVMCAWEKTFTDAEITQWINHRRVGYAQNGYDYFLAIDKERGCAVGQIGLLKEDMGGKEQLALGWILKHEEQGKGYATEGAQALMNYAFTKLGARAIGASIRPSNTGSIQVARRLGMVENGSFVKIYNGKEMVHTIYTLTKKE